MEKPVNRNNVILAILLLVQFGLVVWVFRPAVSENAVTAPLVTKLDAGQVTGIVVQDSTGQVQLAKHDGNWVAPGAGDYPVPEAAVTKLISDVLAIDTGRLVASTPASHVRLNVAADNYVRRVELQMADGKRHVLFAGSSPNVNATHVRVDGQDAVYLTTGALSTDARTDLAGWIDTAYVRINAGEIANLVLSNHAGVFDFAKDSDGVWTLDGLAGGETVNQEAVNGLANRLAAIDLLRPLGKTESPTYGLAQPSAVMTATVQAASGAAQILTVAIGVVNPDDASYTTKASTSDYFATIAGFQVQDFVGKTRADFVVPPPTVSAPLSGTQTITLTGVVTP